MINILFIYSAAINPLTGGVERITYLLADFLQSRNFNIYFLSSFDEFSTKDPRQLLLPDTAKVNSDENIIFYKRLIIEKNIQIVINKSGHNPEMSKLAYHCKPLGVKLISVVHNSPLGSVKNYSSANKSKYKKYHLAWALPITKTRIINNFILFLYRMKYSQHYISLCACSDHVVLESDKFMEELKYLTGNISLDNVIGISNFVILNSIDNEFKKQKEVLYVGRINTTQKRVDLLLKIWHLLHAKFPDWSLKVVGGGDELEKIKDMSTQLNLKNIHFLGYQDAQPFYETASIICLTSAYEGFGITLVEAMSCCVVPVAFKSYLSVTDIIDHKVNGFLVNPFDINEYAETLSVLMASPSMLERYSFQSMISAKKFDINLIGQKWLDVIHY
jgi:glycosyltransferase involved in cell wall biosynthesis